MVSLVMGFFVVVVVGWVLDLFFFFGFSRKDLCVALESDMELDLVDQTGLEITEICLPLPPKYWD